MMGSKINLSGFVGAAVSVCWLLLLSGSSGTFISGEEAIGSPLRVAQCRAQCLQTVSRQLKVQRASENAVLLVKCVSRRTFNAVVKSFVRKLTKRRTQCVHKKQFRKNLEFYLPFVGSSRPISCLTNAAVICQLV